MGGLLSGERVLTVPTYQRPYTWGAKQIDTLFSDLSEKMDDMLERGEQSGQYFLGMILLLGNGQKPDRRGRFRFGRAPPAAVPVDIVDGKQRLVTITIMLAMLRDRLGAEGAGLQALIGEVSGSARSGRFTARIGLSGEEAEFFAAHVLPVGTTSKPVPPGQRTKGARFLRTARRLIRRELDDPSWTRDRMLALADLLQHRCIVNIMQTDDFANAYQMFVVLNGTGLDLTNADLMKAVLIGLLPQARRAHYHEVWTELERSLGGAAFDDLFTHIKVIESRRHSPVVEQIPAMAAADGVERFFETVLIPTAGRLDLIQSATHAGAPQSAEINRLLTYLGWLRSHDWKPAVLVLLRDNPDRPDRLLAFLQALDRLCYGQLLLGIGSERRRKRYRKVLDLVLAGSPFDGRDSPLDLTRDEQKGMLFQANSNLYARGSYVCKLVLLRLCETYPGSQLPRDISRISVEHVLPQNIGTSDYWRVRFPDAEGRERAVRSIANFVLLSRKQNDDARNQAWDRKREIYFREGKSTPFTVTNQLQELADWTPEIMAEREKGLVGRLRDLWSLDGPNETPKPRRSRKPGN